MKTRLGLIAYCSVTTFFAFSVHRKYNSTRK